jgi:hypothetical protein
MGIRGCKDTHTSATGPSEHLWVDHTTVPHSKGKTMAEAVLAGIKAARGQACSIENRLVLFAQRLAGMYDLPADGGEPRVAEKAGWFTTAATELVELRAVLDRVLALLDRLDEVV